MKAVSSDVLVDSVGKEECARHICQLAKDELIARIIETGPFIPFRRKFRRYFMISKDHPSTLDYVRSSQNIQSQKMRHLLYSYYMIHPFSKFCLHQSYVMCFILTMFFILIPCHIKTPLSTKGDTRWIMLILQSVHLINIISNFFIGYHVVSKNIVIMEHPKILKHYLETYFFIEFASVIPVYRNIYNILVLQTEYTVLMYLMFLKILLIPLWMNHMIIIKIKHRINDFVMSMIKIALGFVCSVLWIYCLIWNTSMISSRLSSWTEYLENLETATKLLLLVGTQDYQGSPIMPIVFVCVGFVFQLLLCIGVAIVWRKYSSVFSRQDQFFRGIHAFMRYNGLPASKRDRLNTYFHFKFQGNYYKEQTIYSMLSKELKFNIMQSISENNMQNPGLLLYLPKSILEEISKYFEVETYLTGDVIIRPGSMGDSMYFIVVGTVGIVMPNGQYIATLKDGMNFGEISFILRLERISSVIALKPCEILKLNRNSFIRCFARCSEQFDMIKKQAQEFALNVRPFSEGYTKSMSLSEMAITNPEMCLASSDAQWMIGENEPRKTKSQDDLVDSTTRFP